MVFLKIDLLENSQTFETKVVENSKVFRDRLNNQVNSIQVYDQRKELKVSILCKASSCLQVKIPTSDGKSASHSMLNFKELKLMNGCTKKSISR